MNAKDLLARMYEEFARADDDIRAMSEAIPETEQCEVVFRELVERYPGAENLRGMIIQETRKMAESLQLCCQLTQIAPESVREWALDWISCRLKQQRYRFDELRGTPLSSNVAASAETAGGGS